MNSLLWMLSGAGKGSDLGQSEATELAGDIKTLWSDTIQPIVEIVLWVLVAILAVVFIIKAVMTAMAVMKAADEPQVRQEKIQGFKYLAIALGIAIVILTFANVIMKLLTEKSVDLDGDGKTLLFY